VGADLRAALVASCFTSQVIAEVYGRRRGVSGGVEKTSLSE
jgi:hypothetical protein